MFEHLTMMRTAAETVAREFDPDLITGRDALRIVEEAGAVLRLVQGVLARAARRVAQTDAHVGAGDKDAAQCVARTVGVTVGEARRTIGHAELLAGLPATDAAVRDGRLSARQTGLIVEAATRNPAAEPALLAAAEQGVQPLKDACLTARAVAEDPQVRSERHHAGRSLRMWTDDDGMLAGEFRLTPEAGGAVKALLDGETARRFRQHRGAGTREPHDRYAADALVDLLRGDPETIRGIRYSVHVVIGHGTLVAGGLVPGERCEIPGVGPVDPAWVRDLLGDAFLTAVITTGRDVTTVAHLGRHVPAELRTAMLVQGRECDVDGCDTRGYLEIDHCEIDHARGGPTALWNLVWLCSPHHRRKTRGWTLGPPDPTTRKRTLRPPAGRAPPAT